MTSTVSYFIEAATCDKPSAARVRIGFVHGPTECCGGGHLEEDAFFAHISCAACQNVRYPTGMWHVAGKVVLLGSLALLVGGCGQGPFFNTSGLNTALETLTATSKAPRSLFIVAHQDDDILFFTEPRFAERPQRRPASGHRFRHRGRCGTGGRVLA